MFQLVVLPQLHSGVGLAGSPGETATAPPNGLGRCKVVICSAKVMDLEVYSRDTAEMVTMELVKSR